MGSLALQAIVSQMIIIVLKTIFNFSINSFSYSDRAATFGQIERYYAFKRWLDTQHLQPAIIITRLESVLSVVTQTDSDFFIWIYLVFLFRHSKHRHQKASLRRVISTTGIKPSILSEPYFVVLSTNIGFKPVFRPVDLNIVSSSSYISLLVDCFCYCQNDFHRTTSLSLLIEISRSA